MSEYAVLTGDFVASSKMESALKESVIAWFKELARQFSENNPDVVAGALEVFRGDSWQFALKEPSLAVQASVFLRAGVKAHPSRSNPDTRIGIGIGEVDRIVEDKISESSGPAFVESGRLLDALQKADQRLQLHWASQPALSGLLGQATLPLLDLQVSSWSHPESVAVYGSMMGWTQSEIAAHPLARKADGSHMTQQAVNNALSRIHWNTHLSPMLEAIIESTRLSL